MGDRFELDQRVWLVVGVMQSAGSTFDSEVWAKGGLLGPMFGKETYTSVVVRAEDAATALRLKDFFTNRYKTAAMQAQVETEYFAALSGTSQQFLYGVAIVAVIMAIGGNFGVMNTMFAAISQRTKDIGVLRLLGYSRRQILISFLLESLLIALIGGGLGCAGLAGRRLVRHQRRQQRTGRGKVRRPQARGRLPDHRRRLALDARDGLFRRAGSRDLGRASEAARGVAIEMRRRHRPRVAPIAWLSGRRSRKRRFNTPRKPLVPAAPR